MDIAVETAADVASAMYGVLRGLCKGIDAVEGLNEGTLVVDSNAQNESAAASFSKYDLGCIDLSKLRSTPTRGGRLLRQRFVSRPASPDEPAVS